MRLSKDPIEVSATVFQKSIRLSHAELLDAVSEYLAAHFPGTVPDGMKVVFARDAVTAAPRVPLFEMVPADPGAHEHRWFDVGHDKMVCGCGAEMSGADAAALMQAAE